MQIFFAEQRRLISRRAMLKVYLTFVALLIVGSVQASTITVCSSDCNHSSIQSAIDASHPGDAVEVQSGTYHENVYVRKAIDLKGVDTGSGEPVVDAGGSGSAIILYADSTTLHGFNASHSGHCGCGNAGIKVMCNNSTIFQNIAYENKYGIYCADYIGNIFYQNNLSGNEVSAFDSGTNRWYRDSAAKDGILNMIKDAILNLIIGRKSIGNRYSNYDQPEEGCLDSNSDGICDVSYNISGGSNVDRFPLAISRLTGPVH